MTRSLAKMVEEFKQHWRAYVFQSLLATAVIVPLLIYLNAVGMVITASVGATAFIVFAMPQSVVAQPRNVVGGQLTGLACGVLCAFVPQLAAPYDVIVPAAAAVGLSMFVMVVIDTEHPPAAGTALGLVTEGLKWDPVIAVVAGALVLAAAHHFLKKYLRDLT